MKKQIKVGYLPFFIKLYDESDPNYRTPLVAYSQKLVAMLESFGLEVIVADELCRVKEEFDRAAAKFNDADVDAVITQHLAYSPSLESIDALLSLKAPIIVLDTTVDYGFLRHAGDRNCMRPNHGIHGVQDMCNLLKRNEKPYHLCVGHAMHSEVIAEVVSLCEAAVMAKTFKTEKVGSAGGAFAGMGDFIISDARYREEIGVEVKYLTPDISARHLAAVTEEEINAEMEADKEAFDFSVKNDAAYREATRAGLALRHWMDEEGLGACSVNFLSLDESGLSKMPFVECCKTLARGKGYAGEGDILTAGLVGALFSVYPNTTFVEMFCPDWEENLLFLSHMGETNPRLSQWQTKIIDKPFKYGKTGDTVSLAGCYRPGKAVYVNLAPMKDHFTLILSEVELLDVGRPDSIYARVNQGWMKPCKPLPAFLKEFSLLGGTHHSALVYDGNINTIAAFGEMMGFEVAVIA